MWWPLLGYMSSLPLMWQVKELNYEKKLIFDEVILKLSDYFLRITLAEWGYSEPWGDRTSLRRICSGVLHDNACHVCSKSPRSTAHDTSNEVELKSVASTQIHFWEGIFFQQANWHGLTFRPGIFVGGSIPLPSSPQ